MLEILLILPLIYLTQYFSNYLYIYFVLLRIPIKIRIKLVRYLQNELEFFLDILERGGKKLLLFILLMTVIVEEFIFRLLVPLILLVFLRNILVTIFLGSILWIALHTKIPPKMLGSTLFTIFIVMPLFSQLPYPSAFLLCLIIHMIYDLPIMTTNKKKIVRLYSILELIKFYRPIPR